MLFAILALSQTAAAQVLYGSLTGAVTDSSGGLIPNAHVTALEVSKGIARETQTDSAGSYRVSDMLPGVYRVTIAAPGFASGVTNGIVVNGNEVARVDAKLAPASATATVTVTDAPPTLQTDRADVHTDISPEELASLPSISTQGKNFQELLRIVPGANLPAENNSASANPTRGMTSNVNGQSSQGNSTRIDGVLDLDPWLPNNVAYVPPSTAIGEVNIATNSMDAEQGMVNGAAVNVTIKSGTNKVHGEAHEFHTDDGMKNQNYFNPPNTKKPLNVFNQFGGAVGGPILKNKLFFFGDWEESRQVQAPAGGTFQTVPIGGLNYATALAAGYFDFSGMGIVDSSGNPVHIYDPLTGNSNGTGRTAFANDRIPINRVDTAALTLASLIPAPTPSLAIAQTNNYINQQKGYYNHDSYDAKVNYVPSDKTNYFGRYSISTGAIYDPPALGAVGGSATNGGQQGFSYPKIYVMGMGVAHVFTSNVMLDANVGYTRQHLLSTNIDIGSPFGLNTLKIPGTNDAGLPASNKLYWGIPAFTFNSYSSLGNTAASNPFEMRDNQILGNLNLTWMKGRHQFRFGVEEDHTGLNHFQPQGSGIQTPRGGFGFTGVVTEQVSLRGANLVATDAPSTLQYNSFADFLLGLPASDGKTIQTMDPIALRWNQIGMYARDQWQATPSLTVSYGVRYEVYPMAYSDHGKGTRVLNEATMQVLIGGYGSTPVKDGVQTGHGMILPRLGVAWRPDSKTVVRAGFGLSADSNNWRFMRNDYPANISTSWSGQSTGGSTNYSQFAPSASLTGLNGASAATGPYAALPTGIVLATLPNITSGSIALPNGISTTTIPLNFRRGYIEGYNLAIEREVAGFVADVAYVGSVGIRPLSDWNSNWAAPGGGSTGRVLNSQFGGNWPDTPMILPAGRSSYNSLQAKVTRQLGHASSVGVVETWAKVIDYDDNEENGAFAWNSPALFSKNKGLAGYNRKSNFEAFGVYNLPFGKGERWASSGIGSWIAGGWQLSSILSIATGTPSTVVDNGYSSSLNGPGEQAVPNQVAAISYTKGRPNQNPSTCSSTSCKWFDPAAFARVTTAATMGNVNRNTLIGPGYFDLDGTLHRNFNIREGLTFQIEAVGVGLTNTPHFANPTVDLNSSNFGKVSGTLGAGNAGANMGGTGGERLFFVGGKLIF
jgi:hypothetical protein